MTPTETMSETKLNKLEHIKKYNRDYYRAHKQPVV